MLEANLGVSFCFLNCWCLRFLRGYPNPWVVLSWKDGLSREYLDSKEIFFTALKQIWRSLHLIQHSLN